MLVCCTHCGLSYSESNVKVPASAPCAYAPCLTSSRSTASHYDPVGRKGVQRQSLPFLLPHAQTILMRKNDRRGNLGRGLLPTNGTATTTLIFFWLLPYNPTQGCPQRHRTLFGLYGICFLVLASQAVEQAIAAFRLACIASSQACARLYLASSCWVCTPSLPKL